MSFHTLLLNICSWSLPSHPSLSSYHCYYFQPNTFSLYSWNTHIQQPLMFVYSICSSWFNTLVWKQEEWKGRELIQLDESRRYSQSRAELCVLFYAVVRLHIHSGEKGDDSYRLLSSPLLSFTSGKFSSVWTPPGLCGDRRMVLCCQAAGCSASGRSTPTLKMWFTFGREPEASTGGRKHIYTSPPARRLETDVWHFCDMK